MSCLLGRSAKGWAFGFAALAGGCVAASESEKHAPAAPPGPAPTAPTPANTEAPKAPNVAAPPGAILVDLEWRVAEQDLVRTVDGRVITDDADLETALREAKTRHANDVEAPCAFLDAHDQVPWKDIVTVINTCKRVGIKHMEFGFPKQQSERP